MILVMSEEPKTWGVIHKKKLIEKLIEKFLEICYTGKMKKLE